MALGKRSNLVIPEVLEDSITTGFAEGITALFGTAAAIVNGSLPDEAKGARVHWRSREYFTPGTTVHVDARLYGVAFGDGAYGAADSTLDFDIEEPNLDDAAGLTEKAGAFKDKPYGR